VALSGEKIKRALSERASRLALFYLHQQRERKRQMTNLENKRAGATMHFHCNASAATPRPHLLHCTLFVAKHIYYPPESVWHVQVNLFKTSPLCVFLSIHHTFLSLSHCTIYESVFMVCYNSSKNNGHGVAGGGWCVLAV
jgi:hypothetical protein